MATLVMHVDGTDEVIEHFDRISAAASDMRPVWSQLRTRFVAMEARQFASQGGGSGWAPLSQAYAAEKAKDYPGQPILRRTDRMYDSLVQGPEVCEMTPTMAIFGTAVSYARYHQDGTSKMPRRKVIDMAEAEKAMWVDKIRTYITTAAKTTATSTSSSSSSAGGGGETLSEHHARMHSEAMHTHKSKGFSPTHHAKVYAKRVVRRSIRHQLGL